MAITVYEKPSCTTCKKLAKLFKEQGIEFESVEYHVEGLEGGELRDLLAKAGITANEGLRMREPGAKELKAADEDTVIAAMVANPALLERPFVVNGDKAVLARPVDRALEIV